MSDDTIMDRAYVAYANTAYRIKDFYKEYEFYLNLIGLQVAMVFVTKITEKVADKIIK